MDVGVLGFIGHRVRVGKRGEPAVRSEGSGRKYSTIAYGAQQERGRTRSATHNVVTTGGTGRAAIANCGNLEIRRDDENPSEEP